MHMWDRRIGKWYKILGDRRVGGSMGVTPFEYYNSKGMAFTASDVGAINTTTKYYLIENNDTDYLAHVTIEVRSGGDAKLALKVGSDRNGDTAMTVSALNRQESSTFTPRLDVYEDITGGSTDGTNLLQIRHGIDSNQYFHYITPEIIVHESNNLLIKIQTYSNIQTTIIFNWYERLAD